MNIIKQFTSKNLKLNRKRTIVTIIGIMLSTALICAVAGMVTSFQKTMANAYRQFDGNYYASFEDIPSDQLKYIENNENVKSYFLTENVGYANLQGSQNEDKPYLYFMNFDKNALGNSGLELTSGRMPENSNELVISDSIYTNAKVKYNIGDKVTFNIGDRVSNNNEILTQANSYLSNENSSYDSSDLDNNLIDTSKIVTSEKIINTSSKTYTIVGTIKRANDHIEPYTAAGYTCISFLEDNANVKSANVQVLYTSAKDYEKKSKEIVSTIKSNTGKTFDVKYNTNLARIEGGLNDQLSNTLYILAGIVITIILVSSIFVIRNSFSISVSEKTKQYGILNSIGATSKQIKKSVLYEGLHEGIIGIILGILLGTLAVKILCEVINLILAGMLDGIKFVYSVPLIAILLSIVISAVTIYLSCIIPARRAAKISPIDAIRGSDDIKIKAKKLKTSKLFKKTFGIGGVIAKKNLKRSRKKYRTTVVSLVVSIAIFISLSTFTECGSKIANLEYKNLGYNISIYNIGFEQCQEVAKLDNIKDSDYSFSTAGTVSAEKYLSDFGKDMLTLYPRSSTGSAENKKTTLNIVLLNNDYYKKYIKELGFNENEYKDVIILNNVSLEYSTKNQIIKGSVYNIKSGDNITLDLLNNEKDGTDNSQTIKISKVINDNDNKGTNKLPLGYDTVYYGSTGMLFASEDNILAKDASKSNASMCIDSTNADQMEKLLQDKSKQDSQYAGITVTNYDEAAKSMQSFLLVVSIFLYGFIIVITLIGVTNIFNTITTNMILRSKEFAMLKSIGMTTKEFNKMIRLESIMYGLKSLVIGIPIGIAGSYLISKTIASSVNLGYSLPWTAVIISIVFVFIIVGTTMKYSLNKINKQNIIETIRDENM